MEGKAPTAEKEDQSRRTIKLENRSASLKSVRGIQRMDFQALANSDKTAETEVWIQ